MKKEQLTSAVIAIIRITVLIILSALLAGMLAGCTRTTKKEIARKEEVLLAYLEKKYEEKFEVTNTRYTGSNVISSFWVTPKQDDCYFTADVFHEDTPKQWITDGYWHIRIMKSMNEKYRFKLPKHFSTSTYYEGGNISLVSEVLERYEKTTINPEWRDLEYLEANEPQNINYYEFRLNSFIEPTDEGQSFLYEDVYGLVNHFKALGIRALRLGITVYSTDALADPDVKTKLDHWYESDEERGFSDSEFYVFADEAGYCIGQFSHMDTIVLENIQSIEDLKNTLKLHTGGTN